MPKADAGFARPVPMVLMVAALRDDGRITSGTAIKVASVSVGPESGLRRCGAENARPVPILL